MVISISGRKTSGKSEISKIFKENGFIVLHFADALKNLVCEVLNCNREELEIIKEKKINFKFTDDLIKKVAIKTEIEYDKIKLLLQGKEFEEPRNILQYIGTEIIRNNNPNWHINEVKKQIKEGQNYIFDDCRFENEKKFLEEELSAICWYIIRPVNFNISNHTSETSLNWSYFDEVYINNTSLKVLRKKWKQYLEFLLNPNFMRASLNNFKNKIEFRNWLKKQLTTKTTSEIARELKCSRDKIVWWCDRFLLKISKEKYLYDYKSFLKPTDFNSYCFGLLSADGSIKFQGKNRALVSFSNTDFELVEQIQKIFGTEKPIMTRERGKFKTIYDIDCENPYIVENLKHWNLKPRKSMKEEVPDIIKNDKIYLKNWIVGLIDGDGSIVVLKKNKSLRIQILCSEQVIDFIQKICPIETIKRRHKKLKLFELSVYNHKAVDFYNWLNPKFCLERKWNKINEFIKLETRRKKNNNIEHTV